jgi:TRAP-type C4-dicarboxylate transport system permease small subunit
MIAGGALAAYNPKFGMGVDGLTLVAAAVWKKNWAWWLVGCVTLFIALFFYFANNEKPDNPTGSGAQA